MFDEDFKTTMQISITRKNYILLTRLKYKIGKDLIDRGYAYNVGFNDVIEDLLVRSGYDLKELNKEEW